MGITPFDKNEEADDARLDDEQLEKLEKLNQERKKRLKNKYAIIDQINQANLDVSKFIFF